MRYFTSYLKKVIFLRNSQLLVMRYPPDTGDHTMQNIFEWSYEHDRTRRWAWVHGFQPKHFWLAIAL